jgi:CheY-like chemotaxis protein
MSENDMNARILVVDDEAHILQVLRLKLQNAGHTVTTAEDGEEALDIARDEPLDLVITDFQMPHMTGLELSRALAADPATAAIPILMLTARGHALSASDLGAGNIREVLSKPFSPRAVLHHVASLVGGTEQRRPEAA